MKFVDEATLFVQAGNGGQGSRSFRREKYVPFGGPDGGDGGDGGHIILEASSSLNTLVDFRYLRQVKAGNGDCGHGRQCNGKRGQDKIVPVPVGTLVYNIDTDELLGDLSTHGQRLMVARGGRGGLGNMHFKSSTNQAPQHATPGQPGEARNLTLELKLLADVGLLGLPNAGKSTFIRAVSAARPKVADYPFTTLVPQLGTVRLGKDSSFVIADIPGIIEGANQGAGLGLQFLRHLSRTKVLLHCVDISPLCSNPPLEAIALILNELEAFAPELMAKPRWLVLNKADMVNDEEVEELRAQIQSQYPQVKIYVVSSISHKGLDELIQAVGRQVLELERVCEEDVEIA